MYYSVPNGILVTLDTVIISQLNHRFSQVPNLIRRVTALRWDV